MLLPGAGRQCGRQGKKLVFVQTLGVDQLLVGAFDRNQQLVQLQVKRLAILVLALLNQENHQERDDGRASVDDQLPGLGEAEHRP